MLKLIKRFHNDVSLKATSTLATITNVNCHNIVCASLDILGNIEFINQFRLLPKPPFLSFWSIRLIDHVRTRSASFALILDLIATCPFEALRILICQIQVNGTVTLLVMVGPGITIPIDLEFACGCPDISTLSVTACQINICISFLYLPSWC